MLDISKIYTSKNYGDFKIINYKSSRNVEIEFLSTGFKAISESGNIRKGEVKDKLLPTVYGVGFTSVGEHLASEGGRDTKAYKIWTGMLARCYCPKVQKKYPTYIGVTVCNEWHNFQNFAEWFESNYVEGLHIDKDISQSGVEFKEYNPKTCIFVSQKDNTIEARAKNYKMISPDGVIHEIYNMSEFCRRNKLCDGHMSAVNSGRLSHHKGWTKA